VCDKSRLSTLRSNCRCLLIFEEVPEPSTFMLFRIALTALGSGRPLTCPAQSLEDPNTTHGCAYPLGPEVMGVRLGPSGTGVRAGWDAAERSALLLLAGGLIAVAFA
jgi:hypothetical protein